MKIAIPTDDGKTIAGHFGRCLSYACFDENGNVLEEIKNTSEHMGGQGLPPELLKKNNVEVLLCRDLGPNAIDLCNKKEIKVYKSAEVETVIDLFKLWQDGKLAETGLDDGCESHKQGEK